MRFDGTDTALLIQAGGDTDFEEEFKKTYQQEFGFLLDSRVMVDDVNVSAKSPSEPLSWLPFELNARSHHVNRLKASARHSIISVNPLLPNWRVSRRVP